MSSLMELLKNKKQALAANRRAKTVKPEDGRSRWRVLPGWRKPDAENAEQFWHDFGAHYIKDQSGELKAVYICTDKTFGKPCSICATVQHAIKNTHDDEMVKLLSESRSTGRVLLNALRVDGENPTEPVILEIPPSVFEGMINIINEWGVETLDLATGKDFVIERAGKGKNTKYSVQIAAKSAPVDPAVMKKIQNLDEYVAQESEEQAQRALTNFRQVAGLLPAGVASGAPATAALPSATAKPAMSSMMIDDDDAALAALEAGTEVPAAATKPAAAAPAAAGVETSDSELDDLLASLG